MLLITFPDPVEQGSSPTAHGGCKKQKLCGFIPFTSMHTAVKAGEVALRHLVVEPLHHGSAPVQEFFRFSIETGTPSSRKMRISSTAALHESFAD